MSQGERPAAASAGDAPDPGRPVRPRRHLPRL